MVGAAAGRPHGREPGFCRMLQTRAKLRDRRRGLRADRRDTAIDDRTLTEGQPMSCAYNYDRVGALRKSMRRRARRFVSDQAANTIVTFTLTLPVLVAAAGGAGGYGFAAKTPSSMHAVADPAAPA